MKKYFTLIGVACKCTNLKELISNKRKKNPILSQLCRIAGKYRLFYCQIQCQRVAVEGDLHKFVYAGTVDRSFGNFCSFAIACAS